MNQNCVENSSVLFCFCCSDAIAKLNAYVEKQDEQVSKLKVSTKSHIILLKSLQICFLTGPSSTYAVVKFRWDFFIIIFPISV